MAAPSLTHSFKSQHYTIKEFQLLVEDAPVVPAEIQPFVGFAAQRTFLGHLSNWPPCR